MNSCNRQDKAQIVYFSHVGGPLPILGDINHQADYGKREIGPMPWDRQREAHELDQWWSMQKRMVQLFWSDISLLRNTTST
jgi:hypothetical protein